MPEIGRPQFNEPNAFKNVKMAQPSAKNVKEVAVGDELNELAGKGEFRGGVKFVDSKKHNKMGKDEFLHLLTVQLQNQDPLKPVDQKKFATDLANFSSLEQLTNMNKKMDSMTETRTAAGKFYGASFLGKKIMSNGATLKLTSDGQRSNLHFNLPETADKVIIRVFDEKNQNVANIEREVMRKGSHSLKWDGQQLDGTLASKGDYTYKVFAWDKSMKPFQGKTKSEGLVTGVFFEDNETVFEVDNNRKVYLRDVESFQMPEDQGKIEAKVNAQKINAFDKMKEM